MTNTDSSQLAPARPHEQIDRNSEYAAIMPERLAEMAAAFNDFKHMFVVPLRSGKETRYVILAASVPHQKLFSASGKRTLAVAGDAAGGDTYRHRANFPLRITSVEIWNYDATNAVTLAIDSTAGAGYGAPVYIAPNTYYSMDISLPPEAVIEVNNPNAATVAVQVKTNGF